MARFSGVKNALVVPVARAGAQERNETASAPCKFMRAETKPPGGFLISPEIPAALDNIVIPRTLYGFASEQSVKFPG